MRFTLVTCNPRKINTIIKVFRIEFTSFGIKQEYTVFTKLYFNLFEKKNLKVKDTTFCIGWHHT